MSNSKRVTNITDMNFDETVGSGVTLVDFWAPWCGPCIMQGPILEKTAQQIGDRAKVCKLNVDENRENAMKYGVSSIPTLLIFKNGEVVKQFIGVQREEVLVSSLEEFSAGSDSAKNETAA